MREGNSNSQDISHKSDCLLTTTCPASTAGILQRRWRPMQRSRTPRRTWSTRNDWLCRRSIQDCTVYTHRGSVSVGIRGYNGTGQCPHSRQLNMNSKGMPHTMPQTLPLIDYCRDLHCKTCMEENLLWICKTPPRTLSISCRFVP